MSLVTYSPLPSGAILRGNNSRESREELFPRESLISANIASERGAFSSPVLTTMIGIDTPMHIAFRTSRLGYNARVYSPCKPHFPSLRDLRHRSSTAITVSSGMKCLWNISTYKYNIILQNWKSKRSVDFTAHPPHPATRRVGTPASR